MGRARKKPTPQIVREPRWLLAAVASLVLVFVSLAITSLVSESQTSDEAIHIAAGYAHLTRGDFALNPEHPPLAKEIAALGLLALDVRLPLEHPSWEAAHQSAFQLPLGEQFLHHNAVEYTTILTASRIPIVLLGAALCLVVYAFSRRLFGWQGALVSLALAALSPNLLAHSRLVTTDLAVSLFFITTLFLLHVHLTGGGRASLILAGVATGLTLASKYSAVILLPAILMVLAAHPSRRSKGLVARSGVILATAMVTVAATYGFVHANVYLDGLAGVFTTVTGGTQAYLLGSFSDRGWWYYYPVAVALKTPIPALLCWACLPWLYLRRGGPCFWKDHLVLAVPLVLFAGASLLAARNVGLRHVLPVYPILHVLAGRTAVLLGKLPVVAVVMGLWWAGSAAWIHPAYLAYFNVLGGGPSQGWRYLSDSNIDWGQDFLRLRNYMQKKGIDEILLGHYGNQDPAYYGIRYQYLPGAGHIRAPSEELVSSPRVFAAVSVMTLQGLFLPDREMYIWLREREPVARVGYSLYVYDLTGDRDAFARLAELYGRFGMESHARWASRLMRELPPGGR